MNFFNKLPYLVTGDSQTILANYDLNSRKKIIQLGYAALLPTLIWFATAFLTSYMVLGSSLLISIIVSLFCSFIIFIVERTIVMSKKVSRYGVFFRCLLGILFAIIGSSMLDLIIYQDDIDFKIKSDLINKTEADLHSKSEMVNNKRTELHNEMFGKGGTHMKGYHSASKSIDNQLSDMIIQRERVSRQLDSIKIVLSNPSSPQFSSLLNTLGANTIVYRHEKLFEIIFKSYYEMTFYIIVLLIGMLLEIIPLIIKLTTPESQYEEDQSSQEKLIANRRIRILEKSSYYNAMSQYQRDVYDTMKSNDKFSMLN